MEPVSPLSHLIALGLWTWLALMFRRFAPEQELRPPRLAILALLLAWMVASTAIAYRDLYQKWNEELLLLPLGTVAPFVAIGIVVAAWPRARRSLVVLVERIPLGTLTSVHVVRMLAVGTIYKWLVGELPGHFVVPVAIPDFLIGLTAIPMSRRMAIHPLRHRRMFIAWNAIGASAFLLAVPLIQLSQPGPLHWIASGANTNEGLSFPMSIVPTFIAPLFLSLHAAAIFKVWRPRVPSRPVHVGLG